MAVNLYLRGSKVVSLEYIFSHATFRKNEFPETGADVTAKMPERMHFVKKREDDAPPLGECQTERFEKFCRISRIGRQATSHRRVSSEIR